MSIIVRLAVLILLLWTYHSLSSSQDSDTHPSVWDTTRVVLSHMASPLALNRLQVLTSCTEIQQAYSLELVPRISSTMYVTELHFRISNIDVTDRWDVDIFSFCSLMWTTQTITYESFTACRRHCRRTVHCSWRKSFRHLSCQCLSPLIVLSKATDDLLGRLPAFEIIANAGVMVVRAQLALRTCRSGHTAHGRPVKTSSLPRCLANSE